jgi:replicative DNA helicase
LDAEAAVLSTCMLEGDRIDEVRGVLGAKHFYSEPNRLIWLAIEALHAAGKPADVVTVTAHLRTREQIQRVDVGYLGRVVDCTPAVANVIEHALIVQQRWRQRQLLLTLMTLTAEGYGDVPDPDAWIADARRRVFDAAAHEPLSLQRFGGGYGDLLTGMRARDDAPAMMGLTTEIYDFDAATGGLQAPDVWVLVAEAGGGKTALALGWAIRTALDGGGVYYWNGETGQEVSELLGRGAARIAGVDYTLIRQNPRDLTVEDWTALTGAGDAITGAPILIDDRKDLSADAIVAGVHEARRQLERDGRELRLIVLDNFTEIAAPAGTPSNVGRNVWLEAAAKVLLRAGKTFGVPVLLLAHLGPNGKVYWCPRLNTLAQNVLRLRVKTAKAERVAKGDLPLARPAELRIEKQRNGVAKTVSCWFHGALQRFSDEEWLR